MGVACVVGHGQIAVVQVVLAVRPKERERNKEREKIKFHLYMTFIIQFAYFLVLTNTLTSIWRVSACMIMFNAC